MELQGSRSRGAAGVAEAGVMDAGEGEVAGQARAEVVPRTEVAQSELQVLVRKRRSGGGGAGGGDAC